MPAPIRYSTAQEEAFINAYIESYNATQAFKESMNPQLVQKLSPVAIAKRAQRLRNMLSDRIDKRREQLLEENCIDPTRTLQSISEVAYAAKGDEIFTTKDKLKALELLAKCQGLLEKSNNQSEARQIENIMVKLTD